MSYQDRRGYGLQSPRTASGAVMADSGEVPMAYPEKRDGKFTGYRGARLAAIGAALDVGAQAG